MNPSLIITLILISSITQSKSSSFEEDSNHFCSSFRQSKVIAEVNLNLLYMEHKKIFDNLEELKIQKKETLKKSRTNIGMDYKKFPSILAKDALKFHHLIHNPGYVVETNFITLEQLKHYSSCLIILLKNDNAFLYMPKETFSTDELKSLNAI